MPLLPILDAVFSKAKWYILIGLILIGLAFGAWTFYAVETSKIAALSSQLQNAHTVNASLKKANDAAQQQIVEITQQEELANQRMVMAQTEASREAAAIRSMHLAVEGNKNPSKLQKQVNEQMQSTFNAIAALSNAK